jgi:hypothetical protein
MDEFMGIPSFNTEFSFVDRMIFLGKRSQHLSIQDLKKKATTATAIGTGGQDCLVVHEGLPLMYKCLNYLPVPGSS